MKKTMKSLLIVIIAAFVGYDCSHCQSTIKGTVTYMGSPDVGARIYLIDTNSIDKETLDSAIVAEDAYCLYRQYQHGTIPEWVQKEIAPYDFTSPAFNSLMARGLTESVKIQGTANTQRADMEGQYSMKLYKPGVYYVLIESAHVTGLKALTAFGKLRLHRVELGVNDVKNISAYY